MSEIKNDNDGKKIPTNEPLSYFGFLNGLYREVFGAFVPGSITVVFFIVLPLLTLGVIYPDGFVHKLPHLLECGGSAMSGYLMVTLFFSASYALGSILYRRPLEVVDAIASFRKWCFTKDERRGSLTVQFDKKADDTSSPAGVLLNKYRNELVRQRDTNSWIGGLCQELFMRWTYRSCRGDFILRASPVRINYPYPYMRSYLKARGLEDLTRFVGWGEDAPESKKGNLSSKNSINLLKYRVRFYGTVDMIREMDRNECHIRMINSLWYSFRFVRTMTLFCCLLAIVFYASNILSGNQCAELHLAPCGCFLMLMVLLFLGVTFCRSSIEKMFHYIREREIVFILESADILDRKDKTIFSDLVATQDE